MSELSTPQNGIGGTSFSTSVPSNALILLELGSGQFMKLDPTNKGEGYQLHIVTPLYSEGSFPHQGETVQFSCEASPIISSGMKLSEYPKRINQELQAKIFDKAVMCGPQKFERMKEETKPVTDYQTTEFWGKPYELTYKFSLVRSAVKSA